MNPYRPTLSTNHSAATSGNVELRNPIITRLFAFVPMFIAIRSGLLLTSIYAPIKVAGLTTDHIASGFAAWAISVFAASAFAMLYLSTLKHCLAQRPNLVDKTYDIFGVSLLGACGVVVILPPIVFGWM